MVDYVIEPPVQASLPVQGSEARFPLRRIWCVGRNYAEHAREMGHDPDREPPFFFQKNPDNLVSNGRFPWPALGRDVHHEVELAVALKAGGRDLSPTDARGLVWGHAVALDMTRRDLQGEAKKLGRPWEIGKAFEASAPCSALVPLETSGFDDSRGAITLSVNGSLRQSGDLAQMIWSVPEIIAHLSRFVTLAAGDLILTGTPAGVGPVQPGDVMEARIEGLPDLTVTVTQ